MILGITMFKEEALDVNYNIPLAFPIIAGAGTVTSLLSLFTEKNFINIMIVYILLKSSSKLEKILGKHGINIIRKVFGMVLLAIAFKLLATNIAKIVI